MRTCRIAIFLPSLEGGGAERMMVRLANGMSARGFDVDVVVVRAVGPYLQEVSGRVRIVDLGGSRVSYSLFRLARYLKAERPDSLLSALDNANIVAVLARMISGHEMNLVISQRCVLGFESDSGKDMRSRLELWARQYFYPHADAIVAVSRDVADSLMAISALGQGQVKVIHNPTFTDSLIALSHEPIEHPWLQPGQPQFLLGVGRLTSQKDFQTLIKSFAKVRSSRELRLVILGEGELRPELESMISSLGLTEDVLMPGFANNPFSWMRSSGAFVLSSKYEGFVNVLVEAMACGTPVISTDCPGGPDVILEHEKWGRLVPVGDSLAMADAIEQTLDAKEHPDVAARAAEFSVDKAVDEYLKLLLPDNSLVV
ncbi:MAG: glycosyltransferase [Chlorobiaceae bacterium]|nr:glycosyltransferase [Chlorobiaceae bacterium]